MLFDLVMTCLQFTGALLSFESIYICIACQFKGNGYLFLIGNRIRVTKIKNFGTIFVFTNS